MYSFNVSENKSEYIFTFNTSVNSVSIERYDKFGEPLNYDLTNIGNNVFTYPKNEIIYGNDFKLWVNGQLVYEIKLGNYQSEDDLPEPTEAEEIPKHPIEDSKSGDTTIYKTLNTTFYKDDFLVCFPDFTNALILTYTIDNAEDFTPINQVESIKREDYNDKKIIPIDDDEREDLFSNDDNFQVYYVYEDEENEHLGNYYLLGYNGVSFIEVLLPSYKKPSGIRLYRSSTSSPNLNENVNLLTMGVNNVYPIGYVIHGFLRGAFRNGPYDYPDYAYHPYKKQMRQNRYPIVLDGRDSYNGRVFGLYGNYRVDTVPPMIKNEYRKLSEVLKTTLTSTFEGDVFMDYIGRYAEVPSNTYTSFTRGIRDSTGNKSPGLRMR